MNAKELKDKLEYLVLESMMKANIALDINDFSSLPSEIREYIGEYLIKSIVERLIDDDNGTYWYDEKLEKINVGRIKQ